MNKFISDVINMSMPTLEVADKMLNLKCDGVTLYEAMQMGKAIQKAHNALSDLNRVAYEISEMPSIKTQPVKY